MKWQKKPAIRISPHAQKTHRIFVEDGWTPCRILQVYPIVVYAGDRRVLSWTRVRPSCVHHNKAHIQIALLFLNILIFWMFFFTRWKSRTGGLGGDSHIDVSVLFFKPSSEQVIELLNSFLLSPLYSSLLEFDNIFSFRFLRCRN